MHACRKLRASDPPPPAVPAGIYTHEGLFKIDSVSLMTFDWVLFHYRPVSMCMLSDLLTQSNAAFVLKIAP